MSTLEEFFLDRGMSYTLSKLLPYIVLPLLGGIVWLIIKRRFKKFWVRFVLFLALFSAPLLIYFAMHPIYEGDFANNGKEIAKTSELKSIPATKLLVITIPGCPFCKESIGRMRAFKLRNPNVKIEYRVCSNEKESLKEYKSLASGAFPVVLAKKPKELMDVAGNEFPAFVLIKKNSATVWGNENFGVGALDEVVSRSE